MICGVILNRFQTLTVYAVIAAVLAASLVTASLTSQKTIPGTGSIQTVGVGVYWNQQCTNATSSLNFGLLAPGSSKNFTLYVKNTGNSVLTLSMTSRNWNPTNATNYMTLSWNREGQQINPNQVLGFVITLSVALNVQGISSFSFETVISGTG